MACCGSQRAALRGGTANVGMASGTPFVPRAHEFEYTGAGELQVTGPFTGTLYTFRGRGARLRVDASDVASFVSIPNLRRIP
jgi:hypothetical protein